MKITKRKDGSIYANGHKIAKFVDNSRAVLPILSINKFAEGDYRSDGWIYQKGKRVKKWYISFNGYKFWEPDFVDLKKLYRKYCTAREALRDNERKVSEISETIWKLRKKGSSEAFADALISRDEWTRYVINRTKETNEFESLPALEAFGEKKVKVNEALGLKLHSAKIRNLALAEVEHKKYSFLREGMYRHLNRQNNQSSLRNMLYIFEFLSDSFVFRLITSKHEPSYWSCVGSFYEIEMYYCKS